MFTLSAKGKSYARAGRTFARPCFHDVDITLATVCVLGGERSTCYRRQRLHPFEMRRHSAHWERATMVNNGITPHDFMHGPCRDPGDTTGHFIDCGRIG